jgi:hypothetical protein
VVPLAEELALDHHELRLVGGARGAATAEAGERGQVLTLRVRRQRSALAGEELLEQAAGPRDRGLDGLADAAGQERRRTAQEGGDGRVLDARQRIAGGGGRRRTSSTGALTGHR